MQKLQKSRQGFTIIEVLIVLVIAGLILLIVFLAVPALQRNSRNTRRRNDISALLGAVNEFANNNNGTLPTGFAAANSEFTGGAGTQPVQVTLGFYQPANVSVVFAAGAVANQNNEDTVRIAVNHRCFGATTAGDATRRVASLYTVENSVQQCQDS